MIWAEVTDANPSQWVNTLVADGPGGLCSSTQEIRDKGVGSFLIRAMTVVTINALFVDGLFSVIPRTNRAHETSVVSNLLRFYSHWQ